MKLRALLILAAVPLISTTALADGAAPVIDAACRATAEPVARQSYPSVKAALTQERARVAADMRAVQALKTQLSGAEINALKLMAQGSHMNYSGRLADRIVAFEFNNLSNSCGPGSKLKRVVTRAQRKAELIRGQAFPSYPQHEYCVKDPSGEPDPKGGIFRHAHIGFTEVNGERHPFAIITNYRTSSMNGGRELSSMVEIDLATGARINNIDRFDALYHEDTHAWSDGGARVYRSTDPEIPTLAHYIDAEVQRICGTRAAAQTPDVAVHTGQGASQVDSLTPATQSPTTAVAAPR